MHRLHILASIVLVILPGRATAQDSTLSDLLSETRAETGLVGMGAAVMVDGDMIAIAAGGERIHKSGDAISKDAVWHLGSITKSMTATLAAVLIQEEMLSPDTTVAEVFGESIDDSWKEVTFAQLLTHRSGAPANFSMMSMLPGSPEGHSAVSLKRQEKVTALLSAPRPRPIGEFLYSNAGFTIAGAMMEKVSDGTPWEVLLDEWVMTPLGIHVAYGPPKDETAPWGHGKGLFGKSPKDPAGRADNPAFIGPAGTVALSLPDLLRYGQAHLEQDPKILSRASYDQLHTPPVRDEDTGQGYAYGWVVDPSGGGLNAGEIIWHNGSNTYWYALLILLPEQDTVIAIVSNDGDLGTAAPAAWRLAGRVAKDFSLTP